MVEWIPYLLILVGWNPADPQGTMELQQSLQATREACEAAGDAFLQRQSQEKSHANGEEAYRYFCVPAPTAQDYDDAFESRK